METVNQILNERGARYGTFKGQAEISQTMKMLVDRYVHDRECHLSHDQAEALQMIIHKIARIINGDPNYVDSWIDIAGYATLVADRLNGVER